MRKLIADHMVISKHTSPHVTSFVEVDVTDMVNWRNRAKEQFKKQVGENITFTPIFIEAIVRAIRDFPMINVSVDGTRIIVKKDINIGMAAALPSGNLIVPVIKNADLLNLVGITKQVNDLASRARQNQLKPEEIQGGTFTLTNVGTFGNVMGAPLLSTSRKRRSWPPGRFVKNLQYWKPNTEMLSRSGSSCSFRCHTTTVLSTGCWAVRSCAGWLIIWSSLMRTGLFECLIYSV